MEPLSMILALLVNDPLPDPPNIYRNVKLGLEKRQDSDSSLQPVLSSALHWEPLSRILAFSVNDLYLIYQIFLEMDNSV